MNVDRRWWATSLVRVRVLAAGLALLGAGCTVLGLGFRSHQTVGPAVAVAPAIAPLGVSNSFTGADRIAADEQTRRAHALFAGLPLFFEPNRGQGNLNAADSRAKFLSSGSGYSLFLGTEGAILSLLSHDQPKKRGSSASGVASASRVEFLQMKLAGANPKANLTAVDPLPGKSNYFIGNDPAKWQSRVPHFARVRYENIYPGINLVFYGKQGQLEYDFQVAPGSDPSQAELEFNGAKKLELNDGALVIRGERGSVQLNAPRVYQDINGEQRPVEGSFVLLGSNRAGFAIGTYDRSRELTIDPILTFSTYFGGSGDELNTSVAVDGSFNTYLAGSTTSPTLPGVVTGAFQTAPAGPQNVYIAKIAPPLGSIVAFLDDVTYLGGNGTDSPVGIMVDGASNPFVAGTTSSTNFPVTKTNAYQSSIFPGSTGTSHVFVTKLRDDFTELLYSSYLSGNGTDTASGMTIDAAGDLYVTGTTTSNNTSTSVNIQFPASNFSNLSNIQAYQQTSRAAIQFFVTKVDTASSQYGSIPYSTYFGGGNFNPPAPALPTAIGGGIAVDANENIYFTGTTNFINTGTSSGSDFPILNAYQPCLDTPSLTIIVNPPPCAPSTAPTAPDAFVAKLNPTPSGQQLIWSTYLGGTGSDEGVGIALDPGAANVYIVGTTNSTDIATGVTTLTTTSSYQRCLDTPVNPAIGAACPTITGTPPNDAFVARLTNPTTTTGTLVNVSLNYFSYLGGTLNDQGLAIAVDTNSGALVTGWTQSPDFPVYPPANPIQTTLNGPQDAFVARLNTAAVVGQSSTASWASYFGGSGTDFGTGIALDVNQNTYLAGYTNSIDLPTAKPLPQGAVNSGGYDAFLTQFSTAVSLSLQGLLTLGTNQFYVSAGNPATFTYTITNNGPDLASNITVTDNLSLAVTGIPLTNITGSISSGTCGAGGTTNTSISCGPISLQSGSTATLTITATPTANSNGSSGFFNGGTVQAMAPGNIVVAQTSVPAQMSDFRMSVTPSNQSVPQAGSTATYNVQLTPSPLYNSNITLSCSGVPTGASCNFSPGTGITLQNAGGAGVTLAIPTTARPITPPAAGMFTRHFYALWMAIPGLALLGVGSDRRRRRILGILTLCLMFALILLLPACSHSTTQTPVSGTQAGLYPITVTATSGTDSKSQTIYLNVP